MALIQKYLGWVQRYLYQAEVGELPFPQLTIDINHDWPLVPTTFNRDYATIAGTVTPEIYAPREGKHGLVTFVSTQNPGGGFPNTDLIAINWDRNPSAPPGFIISKNVPFGAVDFVPLIGGTFYNGGSFLIGAPPVYVPAGFRLVLTHTSVAGGINAVCRAQVYEEDSFHPSRHP